MVVTFTANFLYGVYYLVTFIPTCIRCAAKIAFFTFIFWCVKVILALIESYKLAENPNLQDYATCQICQLRYTLDRAPFTMDCGHTYCRHCINKSYVDVVDCKFHCFVCRKGFAVTQVNVAKCNYGMLNFLESMGLSGE